MHVSSHDGCEISYKNASLYLGAKTKQEEQKQMN